MLKIRELASEDWMEYRDIRLRALQGAPDAFGSTFERESVLGMDDWRARVRKRQGALVIAALDEHRMIGLAAGSVSSADNSRADVYQMWVEPEYRGQGISRRLLDEVTAWSAKSGATQLHLDVTIGNAAAEGLYRAAGFKAVGDPSPIREGSSVMVKEMVRKLV